MPLADPTSRRRRTADPVVVTRRVFHILHVLLWGASTQRRLPLHSGTPHWGAPAGGRTAVKPHGGLVRLSYTCHHASTCRLSTYSSRTALRSAYALGMLILEGASHLDAFSGYPCPTSLPGNATGVTTGTQVVGPSRSSRTRDGSPQHSDAHDGYRPNCLTTF